MKSTITLDNLRAQIAALQAEKLMLEEQPRSRAEVAALVKTYVADLVTTANREADLFLIRVSAGGGAYAYATDLPAIIAPAIDPEATTAFLLARLDHIPAGLDKPQRLQRLVDIESSLYQIEVAEEAQIDEVELLTGQYVPRRPDARPEIVLAAIESEIEPVEKTKRHEVAKETAIHELASGKYVPRHRDTTP